MARAQLLTFCRASCRMHKLKDARSVAAASTARSQEDRSDSSLIPVCLVVFSRKSLLFFHGGNLLSSSEAARSAESWLCFCFGVTLLVALWRSHFPGFSPRHVSVRRRILSVSGRETIIVMDSDGMARVKTGADGPDCAPKRIFLQLQIIDKVVNIPVLTQRQVHIIQKNLEDC